MPGISEKKYDQIYLIIENYLTNLGYDQGRVLGDGTPIEITDNQRNFLIAKVQQDARVGKYVATACVETYYETEKVKKVLAVDIYKHAKVKAERKQQDKKRKISKEEAKELELLDAEVKTDEEKEENP